jgi:hypothetical protein
MIKKHAKAVHQEHKKRIAHNGPLKALFKAIGKLFH